MFGWMPLVKPYFPLVGITASIFTEPLSHICFPTGIAFGGLMTLSSYNPFNNNSLRYVLFTSFSCNIALYHLGQSAHEVVTDFAKTERVTPSEHYYSMEFLIHSILAMLRIPSKTFGGPRSTPPISFQVLLVQPTLVCFESQRKTFVIFRIF